MSSSLTIQTGREVEQLRHRALRMGGLAERLLDASLRALWTRDTGAGSRMAEDDRAIDQLDVEIDAGVLSVLALRAPVASDLRQTLAIKALATDLERIGDLAQGIAASAARLAGQPAIPPPALLRELADGSRRALDRALQAFADGDAELARLIQGDDDRIRDVERRVVREAIARIQRSPDTAEQELELMFIARRLERIADHAARVARQAVVAAESPNPEREAAHRP